MFWFGTIFVIIGCIMFCISFNKEYISIDVGAKLFVYGFLINVTGIMFLCDAMSGATNEEKEQTKDCNYSYTQTINDTIFVKKRDTIYIFVDR